jgi:hypothetical protein
MKHMPETSLKSMNLKWLVSLAFFDVLICIFLISPQRLSSASIAQVAVSRGLFAVVLPVLVLLVVNVLPHVVFCPDSRRLPGTGPVTIA